ncbi:MAG: aminotransferase class III-fold pyridoxal phosphate-dependent enzyme [Pseudomonadales bacterium]|jgi:adenosylmethionine-8-amino-7-oxononanoate aminotransferase|nr:aminotransferase class III-fold pyridoxal phosphate-dependent enzyme [Pseudomonadales bacterium]MDP6471893.1 aminotransferase class III-fold pyridoxal phosphate-dependent enzyme [Pseudomonadales bacterium]MDP6826837.1 aminotransferase class III-fold pyridoxal phosphate-dependent enzyme [Pseudomonadales bacterium]MDP6970885.1 aminotransferase class III-fold pyridoxal phosphate-dependent enzyme [Pseudomonadales bacterium]
MTRDVNWPFSPGRSINIVNTEGVYLYTDDGQRLLDAAGGAIVVNVGHGLARVADRVAEATLQTTYVVPPWLTPGRERLANTLTDDWLPQRLSRIHMTSGGSEAVESAIKIALQYHAARGDHARTRILGREISYHGTTLVTMAAGGHEGRKKGFTHALKQSFDTYPKAPTPYPLRCPLGSHHPDAGAHYIDATRAVFEAVGAQTIAAFVAEPITGSSGGAIVPPDGYWEGIRALCDEFGVLLIMDEVMTGFGRTGLPFGYQHWDIEPDILVSGKGLAGGYAPLGGVFTREDIGQALDDGGMNVMFHTFGAHPAACAAAAEVLTIMSEDGLVERARTLGEKLERRLNDAFSNHPYVAEVRGRGLLQAIELVEDRDTLEPFAAERNITNRVVGAGLKRGVFFYGGGTGVVRDIVCMGPPFIITEAEIDFMVDTLSAAVDQGTGG